MSDFRDAAAIRSDRQRPLSIGLERRQHPHLRELIDEMMASLRAAANRDLFTTAERADAETQLSLIMARVHEEALAMGDRRIVQGGA